MNTSNQMSVGDVFSDAFQPLPNVCDATHVAVGIFGGCICGAAGSARSAQCTANTKVPQIPAAGHPRLSNPISEPPLL